MLLACACRDWREHVEQARAASEPEQVLVVDLPPIEFEAKHRGVHLRPRATYKITGYAAETDRKLHDGLAFVMPMDLALVWGPVADPAVLRHLTFDLSRRYVSYRYDASTPPTAVGQLLSHIANNHLIPATEEVAKDLQQVRVGDLVTMQGKLVDVEVKDRDGKTVLRSRTSLSREDVGSGACEIVWVESVIVDRPE